MEPVTPLRVVFASHSRQWRDFHYVYPVISRRAKGLSVGINLNPDTACNFDCVYCQVDRTKPPRIRRVEPDVLERELHAILVDLPKLFEEPEFRAVPPGFRRLNDIAFSGDGEPTFSPVFDRAAHLVADVRQAYGVEDAKTVIITDACYLSRPRVRQTLEFLDAHNLEIWAKLDAGTEAYYQQVNRPNFPLAHVLDNIRDAARVRPIVIQSLFMRLHGEPPPNAEIEAYLGRLQALLDEGAQLKLVQVYTVARQTAESYVSALSDVELRAIADRVSALGIPVESYV